MAIENVIVTQETANITVTQAAPLNVTVTPPEPINIEVSSTGTQGAVGPTPNLQPGTITTGAPGSAASMTITGTALNPLLNLIIPRGDTGATGPAPTLNQPVVTQLAIGSTPTASFTGTNPYTLNLGIPIGANWLNGTAPPATGSGNIGDYYLITSGTGLGDVYKKTGASTWTLQGNIRGAAGTGDMSKLLSNFTNWTAPAVFRDVFSWGASGPTNNGSVIITTNIPTDSGSMLRVDIEGEIYTAGTFNGFLEVYMYNSAGGTIYQPKWTNFGALDVPMRLAKNASNNLVIILDAPTGLGNNWSYPRIKVVKVTPTVANSAHYTGWSAVVSTDTTTGLSNHVTAAVALDSKYVNSTSAQTIAGAKTFTTSTTIDVGGQALTIKPGTADSAYIGLNARTATPATRTGYLGFGGTGSTLSIQNEISAGAITIATTGNGGISLNAGTGGVSATGNFSVSGTTNSIGNLSENGQRVYSPNNIPSASVFTTGTLADARLSTNVALLTGTQTFTGAKTFSSTVTSNGTGVTFAGGAGGSFTLPDGVNSYTPQIYQSITTGGIAGIGVQVQDGTNNRRAGLFVNHTNGLWGLSHTASTGAVPFVINYANIELMRITSAGFAGFGTTNPSATLQVYSQNAGTRVLTISGRGTTVAVTNKALTANVATLTTGSAHGFTVGRTVLIQGVDATFNGTYTIASAPTTTSFTYALTAADVASTAATGTAQSDVQTADLLRIEGGRSNSLITINNNGVPNFGVGIQLTGRTTLDNSIGLSGGDLYFEGAVGRFMYFRPNGAGSNTGMVTFSTTGITSAGTGTSTFSGPITATSFSGSGASLTSLTAANINGVIPIANIPTGTTGTTVALGNHLHTGVYEPVLTAGTTAQYYRGDKSWQTLDKTAVGLANVLNVAQEPAITAGTTAQFYRGDKTWQTLDVAAVSGAAPLASPTFTGTVSGITASMVGLGNVANVAQVDLTSNQTIGGEKTFSSVITGSAGVTTGGVLTVPGTSYQTFGAAGTGAPTFTTRSAGTKIVLYDNIGASTVDYAIGIETGGNVWFSAAAAGNGFKFFSGTTNTVTITGAGNLSTVGTITAAGTGFAGPGANITTLNASSLSSGTVPDVRLPTRLGAVAKSVADWNDANQNGYYMASGAANAPASGWFLGHTLAHRDTAPQWGIQTLYPFTNSGINTGADSGIWRRVRNNDVWGSWYRVLDSQQEIDTRYLRRVVFTSASQARPDGNGYVEWVGPVQPTNAIDGDTWVNTA